MDNALELQGINKAFGATRAIDDLSLVIPRGATYGLIGPSGAGKTTAIRMIMSILFPDSGSLRVLGRASALEAKSRIGYLPEERGVYRKKCGSAPSYPTSVGSSPPIATRSRHAPRSYSRGSGLLKS